MEFAHSREGSILDTNPSLFMTITTGLLLSNTCVCMQFLDFGAQHTPVVYGHATQNSTSGRGPSVTRVR